MPAPVVLPAILGIVAGAAIAATVIYFFLSNDSERRQEEYKSKVNAVLRSMEKKITILEILVHDLKQKFSQEENANADLRAKLKLLEEELAQTRLENQMLEAELKNWKMKENRKSIWDMIAIVRGSYILKMVNWKPAKAFEYLNERNLKLNDEIDVLRRQNDEGLILPEDTQHEISCS